MADFEYWPPKDPNAVEPYFIIWCDKTGLNTGAAADHGELQGATISTATWTVPTGIVKDSSNQNAVTIHGIVYPVNTVTTITLSSGTADTEYTLSCRVTTSDSRTLDKTVILRVENL